MTNRPPVIHRRAPNRTLLALALVASWLLTGFPPAAAGERMNLYPVNHGNQPSMQAAWLFNWAGASWLRWKWTRAILEACYECNPADADLGHQDQGDQDQGRMSAWFVMASLGLFQTDGGPRVNPIYEIGSLFYPKATLHLGPRHSSGKTFPIAARNTSPVNRYIQSTRLKGKPLNHSCFPARDLQTSGQLELVMGPSPSQQWPADAALT